MAEMGFKVYRMSISWNHILPDGEGGIDQRRIGFYRGVFHERHKYDIKPIVAIFHFDLPLALQQEYGGWNNRQVIDTYMNYCQILFKEYKDDVYYWLTHNEQNMLIFFGTVDMTGGTNQLQTGIDLHNQAHIQLITQAKAVKLCHEMCPNAKVGPTPNITTSYSKTCSPIDYIASLNVDNLRNNLYLDALVFGTYLTNAWKYFKDSQIILDIHDGDFKILREGHPDFTGFNYYGNDTTEYLEYYPLDMSDMMNTDNHEMSYLVKLMDKPGVGRASQGEYLPEGEDGHAYDPYCIRVTARRLTDRYHLPLIITEDGYGRPDISEKDGTIHDSCHIEHLRETIRQMEIDIREGTNTFGYCP